MKPKHRIFIADGTIELRVEEVTAGHVTAHVVEGGLVTSRKGVNFPDTALSAPSLTKKDEEDLAFGLAAGVDWVSVSFVRSAADITRVKEIIASHNKRTHVIAKIEKAEAVADIEAIIEAADGLMIARGDLGVETPLEEVPHVQKRLIDLANAVGKPVITATQMLESMVQEQRPTRAEVADVANAVMDGTDAVMLSEETAVGKNPALVVAVMARIAAAAVAPFPDALADQDLGLPGGRHHPGRLPRGLPHGPAPGRRRHHYAHLVGHDLPARRALQARAADHRALGQM